MKRAIDWNQPRLALGTVKRDYAGFYWLIITYGQIIKPYDTETSSAPFYQPTLSYFYNYAGVLQRRVHGKLRAIQISRCTGY